MLSNLRTNTAAMDDDEEEGRGGGIEVVSAVVDDEGPINNNNDDGMGGLGGDSSSAFDDAVVRRAVSDAGQFAFGIVMVEVWLLSKDQTRLYRPPFGLWVDPVYASSSDQATRRKLARLMDPTRKDYVPATTLAMGEGLAGMLYVEAKNMQGGGMRSALMNRMRGGSGGGAEGGAGGAGGGGGGGGLHRRSSEARIPRSGSVTGPTLASGGSPDEADDEGANAGVTPDAATNIKPSRGTSNVFFRNVNQISADPDQPFSPRLRMIADLGLGWCVAVPMFQSHTTGIVLYLARNHVSLQQLQSPFNQNYLVAAAHFIGAALDLREPRRVADEARRQQVRNSWVRVRDRIVYLKKMGIPLADAIAQAEAEKHKLSSRLDLRQSLKFTVSSTQHLGELLSQRFVMMLKKSRGGGGMVPPAMSGFQSCYSFVGAFVTLTILHFINERVEENYDAGLALGPFGGLVTMMYSLSSAPASQPRNAVLGQALSIAIGLGFSYITSIPTWLRVNLATSLAVAAMSKFAIIHPPAGGAAFTFASGALNWGTMLVFLVGYVITIMISMILNNWSVERQYPIYWGVPGANKGGNAVKAVQARLVRGEKGQDQGEGGAGDHKKV